MKTKKSGGRRKKVLFVLAFSLVFLLFAGMASGFIQAAAAALYAAAIKDLPKGIVKELAALTVRLAYAAFMWVAFYSRIAEICEKLPELLLINPELMIEQNGELVGNPPVENLVNFMIHMMQPFYLLSIILIGFYLLFVSGSPLGRARAKASVIKLVISMAVILFTVPILQFMIDISEFVTVLLLNSTDVSVGTAALKKGVMGLWSMFSMAVAFNYWNAIYLVMFTIIMCISLFLLIAARYFIILLMVALFPFTIFLYSFYFTSRVGHEMFKQTLTWIFIQPLMAMLLVGISVAAYSAPMLESDSVIELCFGLASFLALVIAPIMITGVIDWLAMLMVMLTGVELAGMHGLIGMIDELQVEGPEVEYVSPPPPVKPRTFIP